MILLSHPFCHSKEYIFFLYPFSNDHILSRVDKLGEPSGLNEPNQKDEQIEIERAKQNRWIGRVD